MTEQSADSEFENAANAANAANAESDERDLWPSPGQKIRKLREERGFSREEVSEALFITVHYVTALENDDFQKLPGQTFTKGYFRSYAEFLGADVDEILGCYQNFINAGKKPDADAEREKQSDNKKIILWIVVALVIVAVLLGGVLVMSNDASARENLTANQKLNLTSSNRITLVKL